MTQSTQIQKPQPRKKLSLDVLEELNMLSALAVRAPEQVAPSK